jgi:hypothetical protein
MASEYQHIADYDGVLRYIDTATIPPDEANRDWQIYLEYVADGGSTDPAPVPPEIVPTPDPNVRLDDGVEGAVAAWNELTPAEREDTLLTNEGRLDRLEASLKALLEGHGLTDGGTAALDA